MAASPLNGPVVLVRSGRVCQRPAGPLLCGFPHKLLDFLALSLPVVSMSRKPVAGGLMRTPPPCRVSPAEFPFLYCVYWHTTRGLYTAFLCAVASQYG